MNRRRLRIVSSSDEEDDDRHLPPPPPPPPPPPQQHWIHEEDDLILDDIETDFQTVTLSSANPTPGSNNSATATHTQGNRQVEPIHLDMSDDEPEDITIGGDPTVNSPPEVVNGNIGYSQMSESPVHLVLERRGLRLRREWLESCLQGLQASAQGFQRMDDSAKAKLCFQQFLRSDMNFCGAGVLPPNVHTLHLVDLKGPFVLQVDEVINISSPLRGRYQKAAAGIKRCLKLSITDGIQRVFGMEYRPIKDLEVLGPAGLKVAVRDVHVKHGLLMLVPEVVEVLGGTVDELEAARQRLVEEVNKPPRGRRNRTGEAPPLTTRATLAAWPPSNDAVQGHLDNNRPTNVIPLQPSRQGSAASVPVNEMHRQGFATPVNRNNVVPNSSHAPCPPEQDGIQGYTDTPMINHSRQGPNRLRQDTEVPYRSNTMPAMQRVQSVTTAQHINEPSAEVMTPLGGTRQDTPANYMPREYVHVVGGGYNDEANTSPIHMDVDELSMADELSVVDDLEYQFIHSRDEETPFTYLASLSAKCAANDDEFSVVRGKIKCFITSVKGFQYRGRTTYELRVYIDDGSLISEILIAHNVVRNKIGYSIEEVTSASTSTCPESKPVREAVKEFQVFLSNFEGTMIVEMSAASPIPVAVEMKQGCVAFDARVLFDRVKLLSCRHEQSHSHSTPIELSP